MMHLLAYTSEIDPASGDEDAIIKDIIAASQENNAETNITGALFYHEGHFLQVIEGEEADLRALMDTISQDKRHKNIRMLVDTPEKERGFGGWKMDEIQLGKGKDFDPEYLEKMSKKFEKFMVPSCDMLVHFYKTILAEKKRVMGIF